MGILFAPYNIQIKQYLSISSWDLVLRPPVEVTFEALRFMELERCHQFPRFIRLLIRHVTNINLCCFVSHFDFHIACPYTDPKKDQFSIVDDHNVVIVQVVL